MHTLCKVVASTYTLNIKKKKRDKSTYSELRVIYEIKGTYMHVKENMKAKEHMNYKIVLSYSDCK